MSTGSKAPSGTVRIVGGKKAGTERIAWSSPGVTSVDNRIQSNLTATCRDHGADPRPAGHPTPDRHPNRRFAGLPLTVDGGGAKLAAQLALLSAGSIASAGNPSSVGHTEEARRGLRFFFFFLASAAGPGLSGHITHGGRSRGAWCTAWSPRRGQAFSRRPTGLGRPSPILPRETPVAPRQSQ